MRCVLSPNQPAIPDGSLYLRAFVPMAKPRLNLCVERLLFRKSYRLLWVGSSRSSYTTSCRSDEIHGQWPVTNLHRPPVSPQCHCLLWLNSRPSRIQSDRQQISHSGRPAFSLAKHCFNTDSRHSV